MNKQVTQREIENLLNLYKSEKIKNSEDLKQSKVDFISQIKQISPDEIKNTPIIEKKYTIWERIKRVLRIH
jgi:transcription initiation factor IIF auxiliary subunit